MSMPIQVRRNFPTAKTITKSSNSIERINSDNKRFKSRKYEVSSKVALSLEAKLRLQGRDR